jgi:hypothetical protein
MGNARRGVVVLFVLTLAQLAGSGNANAQNQGDPREVEARALFVRGEYRPALEMFSGMYAENPDPVYLRNIGRCHQKLRDPDRAIEAFREYLRLGNVDAAETAEVQGFIREMEELRPRSPAPPVSVQAPPPVIAVAPPPAEAALPMTRRWWFWAAAGAVVLGAVATAVVLGSSPGGANRPACPPEVLCR